MTEPDAPLREIVAAEVRAWQGRRRLSSVRLARMSGLSQPYLARRLAGRYALTLDDVAALADAFEIHPLKLFPDDYVRGRDQPRPRRPEPTRAPARPRQSNGPSRRRP